MAIGVSRKSSSKATRWTQEIVQSDAHDLIELDSRSRSAEPVLRQWNAGISTLLRAPMDQTILADVHVARSRPALPRVRAAVGEVALKQAVVRVRVEAARELHDLFIDRPIRAGSSGTI